MTQTKLLTKTTTTLTTKLNRSKSVETPDAATNKINRLPKTNLFRHHTYSFSNNADVILDFATRATMSAYLPSDVHSVSTYYTSLKDLFPCTRTPITTASSAIAAGHAGHEVAIRFRLLKQAAWAYMRPLYALPEGKDRGRASVFRRVWDKFTADVANNSLVRVVNRAVGWVLRAVRMRVWWHRVEIRSS